MFYRTVLPSRGGMKTAGVIALVLACRHSSAGVAPPDYGLNWVTIGDPGNRGVLPSEVPAWPELADRNMGAVSYEFRLTQTEITVRQWHEFVSAYVQFNVVSPVSPPLTGPFIAVSGSSATITTSNPDQPTTMSWEFAARYCNWLHNGKALTADAFENGAYDTSTFTRNPDGTSNHQLTRSEGALFWIPSLDEWTKGAHWDPAKNNGEGGYWRYPGASDEPLIPGPPGQGGQTNAGAPPGPATAGSYPDVSGPWGLLDASGGVREWTETTFNPVADRAGRRVRGSARGSSTFELIDSLDFIGTGSVTLPTAGVRIASVVPAPHSAAVFGMCLISLHARRRRTCTPFSGDSQSPSRPCRSTAHSTRNW